MLMLSLAPTTVATAGSLRLTVSPSFFHATLSVLEQLTCSVEPSGLVKSACEGVNVTIDSVTDKIKSYHVTKTLSQRRQ